jgi:Zn-dependent protease
MGDLSLPMPSWTNLLFIPGLIAGFIIHELAHALIAYFLGDLSQAERGRITLNPFRHISWFGVLTFVLFRIGWAKPVRIDPRHFKHRYLGTFLVAIAGAAANLVLAGCIMVLTVVLVALTALFSQQDPSEVLTRLAVQPNASLDIVAWLAIQPNAGLDIVAWTAAFTIYSFNANLILAFFNLLPFPTLDGFTALASLIGLLRSLYRPSPQSDEERRASPIPRPALGRGSRQPAVIHFELGAEYHAASNYEDAIARYRQAIANDRGYGPAYVNLGLAYLSLGQRDRAIQAFRGATQYAADEKSKNEAWAQLNKLSQYSPLTPSQAPSPPDAGQTGPWTDVRPAPNWLVLGLSSLLTLAGVGCIYVYLTIALIGFLTSGA